MFLDQLVTYFFIKMANSLASPSFFALQSEASKSWQAVKKNGKYTIFFIRSNEFTLI